MCQNYGCPNSLSVGASIFSANTRASDYPGTNSFAYTSSFQKTDRQPNSNSNKKSCC